MLARSLRDGVLCLIAAKWCAHTAAGARGRCFDTDRPLRAAERRGQEIQNGKQRRDDFLPRLIFHGLY